jgi:hypothetical protein
LKDREYSDQKKEKRYKQRFRFRTIMTMWYICFSFYYIIYKSIKLTELLCTEY